MHQKLNVSQIMQHVIWGLIPAILISTFFYGFNIIIHIIVAIITAIISEFIILKLRNINPTKFLNDYSAILTAILFALSMPTQASNGLIIIGTAFAIILVKQLYGGLGQNLFNPAMMAFAVMMISFPQAMTNWSIDGLVSATPLDTIKTNLFTNHSVQFIFNQYHFDISSIYINFAYLAGGCYLLWRKIITWHIPVAFLGGLFFIASIFRLIDYDLYTSPFFHLVHGATMMGAFFIATDPVTASTTPKGKIIYAISIGFLTYFIRVFGGYPDGVAFAVILMNLCVPLIDQYTQPKTFGRKD